MPRYPSRVRIYTRTGDDGTTARFHGKRVSKADPTVELSGAIDEAVAALGVARALCAGDAPAEEILRIQRELFVAGADLSAGEGQRDKLVGEVSLVTPAMTARIEELIDRSVSEHPLPQGFVVPGANERSASLDTARTLVRRAERRAADLKDSGGEMNDEAMRYLNRLSDLLFVLARVAAGESEAPSREE